MLHSPPELWASRSYSGLSYLFGPLAYGLAGTFNFGKLGQISKVQSPEDKKADRKTAVSILFQSIALAGLITAIFFVLPL